MINIKELRQYYPDLKGFERSILREYLQYKILNIIFQSREAAKISFLGGTAIKICYGSFRFSEDLDFDNFKLSRDEFKNIIFSVKKGLEQEGYEAGIKLVFKGAFRAYIKIPKLLSYNNLSHMESENLTIQIDTAPHGFKYKPKDFLLQKFEVFRNIKITPADILLSQKVAAILGRKRAKGRDYFDLVFLMGITDFNFDYLKALFMYFRFCCAIILLVSISLIGIFLEKQNLQYRRSISK
ncbi:hypothetical protein DRH27_06035, partial [Candidatus Falkowbacteria bacterium]